MDVAMPEMDGLEATRTIRALEGELGRVPIVAMTASAFHDDKQRCLSAGMDDYLSKPIVRSELLAAVDRWLRSEDKPPDKQPADMSPQEGGLLDEAVLAELETDVTAELLPGMVRTFVAEGRRRLARINFACESRDLNAVGEEAHAFKGAAGTFGAIVLQAEALELERAGKAGKADLVDARMLSFSAAAAATLGLFEKRFGAAGHDQCTPAGD
jgi:HPt (histidine-containing phosphotransfer) domain-containing protein